MIHLKIIGLSFFISLWGFSQGEVEEIEPVTIYGAKTKDLTIQTTLSTERIQNKLAADIGQLTTFFPGIQLRSYGGVGGLKTIGFRSLGAAHTSVVQDRIALSTSQTGQTDLSQLPADFVSEISLVSMASTAIQLPISSKIAGALLSITTQHAVAINDTFQLKLGAQYASFNQFDAHLFSSKSTQKWRFAFSAKARQFEGNYPFQYQNGSIIVRTKRKNGDLKDLNSTFSVGYNPNKNNQFYFFINGSSYTKGLPGAVVFYNESADQRLIGNQLSTAIQHTFSNNKLEIASQISAQKQYLNYTDSSYLNSQGYLVQAFHSEQTGGQTQLLWKIRPTLRLSIGSEITLERVRSEQLVETPTRLTNNQFLGLSFKKWGLLQFQTGFQTVSDQRVTTNRNEFTLLPAVDWQFQLGANTIFGFNGRITKRQPTFSELYYQQIGNDALKPEEAQLVSVRLGNKLNLKRFGFQTTLQPFFTTITNKILAIPTKNLFIWSIQNIGKSDASGVEFSEHIFTKIRNSNLDFHLNYTFQYTRDLSDPKSSTYKDILSYSPLHSGTSELDFNHKKWGVFVLFTYQGSRYSLNENIPNNLLEAFYLIDIGGNYAFPIKNHQLVLRATINNITNRYYSYIRYFVMPGTQFSIRLSYVL